MIDLSETAVAKQIEQNVAYRAALGQFIHIFSQIECQLQTLLWKLSGMPIEVARVAFHSARYSQLTSLINRLVTSRGEAPNKFYERGAQQLGYINAMRNAIVHLGPQLEDGFASVSTTATAMPGAGVELRIDIPTLKQMIRDMFTITACFQAYLDEISGESGGRADYYRQVSLDTWQYKPAPPGPGQKPPQGSRSGRGKG